MVVGEIWRGERSLVSILMLVFLSWGAQIPCYVSIIFDKKKTQHNNQNNNNTTTKKCKQILIYNEMNTTFLQWLFSMYM